MNDQLDVSAYFNKPTMEVDSSANKESGEAIEPDTSDENLEEENDGDDNNNEEETVEEPEKTSDKNYQSLYDDAEQKRISQQSRADRSENENKLLKKQLVDFQNQINEIKTKQDEDQNSILFSFFI